MVVWYHNRKKKITSSTGKSLSRHFYTFTHESASWRTATSQTWLLHESMFHMIVIASENWVKHQPCNAYNTPALRQLLIIVNLHAKNSVKSHWKISRQMTINRKNHHNFPIGRRKIESSSLALFMLAREWVKWEEKRENPISTQIFPLRLRRELPTTSKSQPILIGEDDRFDRDFIDACGATATVTSNLKAFFFCLSNSNENSINERRVKSAELSREWSCAVLNHLMLAAHEKKKSHSHFTSACCLHGARRFAFISIFSSFLSFFFPSTSELWATIAMDVDDGKLYNNETRLAKRFSWCSAVKHESSLKKSGWEKVTEISIWSSVGSFDKC